MTSINCGASNSSTAISFQSATVSVNSSDSFQSASGSLSSDVPSVVKDSESVHRKIAAGTAIDSGDDFITPSDVIDEPETIIPDEIAYTQTINSTQQSNTNFLAQMDKRCVFYKCENITINFKEK